MAYYNAPRQSLFTLSSLSSSLVRNECDLQSLRLRVAVAVAFGIVFFLWIFTGFAACTLTRSVQFLENVYTLQLLLWCLLLFVVVVCYFLLLFLLFSNCKYALEFLWFTSIIYKLQVRFLLATSSIYSIFSWYSIGQVGTRLRRRPTAHRAQVV